MPTILKTSGKVIVALLLIGMFCILSSGGSTAHAQATHQTLPAADTSLCVPHVSNNGGFQELCSGPSIHTSCSGMQFFPATDGFGIAIDWTFTDQNNTCVTVSYSVNPGLSDCAVWFYVPDGNATATFSYTWFNGATHTGSLNENPVNGWQQIISSAGHITSLSFTDHDSPGALQLGWGSTVGHSLKVECGA